MGRKKNKQVKLLHFKWDAEKFYFSFESRICAEDSVTSKNFTGKSYLWYPGSNESFLYFCIYF